MKTLLIAGLILSGLAAIGHTSFTYGLDPKLFPSIAHESESKDFDIWFSIRFYCRGENCGPFNEDVTSILSSGFKSEERAKENAQSWNDFYDRDNDDAECFVWHDKKIYRVKKVEKLELEEVKP